MKIQVFMPTNDRHMRYKSQLTVALGVALLAMTMASDVSAQSAIGSKVAQAGQFVNNGQTYQVMQASQVPTAADRPGSIGAAINGRNPVQQVGCQSCGTSCGGACGGYSTYSEDFMHTAMTSADTKAADTEAAEATATRATTPAASRATPIAM